MSLGRVSLPHCIWGISMPHTIFAQRMSTVWKCHKAFQRESQRTDACDAYQGHAAESIAPDFLYVRGCKSVPHKTSAHNRVRWARQSHAAEGVAQMLGCTIS